MAKRLNNLERAFIKQMQEGGHKLFNISALMLQRANIYGEDLQALESQLLDTIFAIRTYRRKEAL